MCGADAALTVMRQAVRESGRQEFVTTLFRLWPSAQGLLQEVGRRLGGEIRCPGDKKRTLLAQSIRAGYANFNAIHKPRSRHGCYALRDWEETVYLGFFIGLYRQAAEVGYCRVEAPDGSVWTVQGLPYLTWRERHPGPVAVLWDGPNNLALNRLAWRLAWQTLLACRRRRQWIERRMLAYLGSLADVEA